MKSVVRGSGLYSYGGITLDMALVSVGFGAVLLEPKRRFMTGKASIEGGLVIEPVQCWCSAMSSNGDKFYMFSCMPIRSTN